MKVLLSRSLLLVSGLTLAFSCGCGSTESTGDPAAAQAAGAAVVGPAEAVVEESAMDVTEPVIEEPAVEEPVVEEPVVAAPVAKQPEPVVETPKALALDRVEIVRSLVKGDLRRFRLVESEESDINMGMQGSLTSTRKTSTEWSFEVLDVDPTGKATLEVKVGRVHGAIENPMLGEVAFDSAAESEGTGNPMLDTMVKALTMLGGKTFRAALAADGDLSDFQGLQELLDAAAGGMGGMGMGMGMGGGITASAVTQSLNQALIDVPAGFHTVGDTWERETSGAGAMGRSSSVKTKAVLKEIGATEVTIATHGTVEVTPPSDDESEEASGDMQAAMMRQMMKSMKMVESSVEGTVRVGRADGLVVSRVSKTSYTIEMASPMGGDDKLVVKTKSTSELSRITAE